MNEKDKDNAQNIVAAYDDYKIYYDRKAQTQPFRVHDWDFVQKRQHDD